MIEINLIMKFLQHQELTILGDEKIEPIGMINNAAIFYNAITDQNPHYFENCKNDNDILQAAMRFNVPSDEKLDPAKFGIKLY